MSDPTREGSHALADRVVGVVGPRTTRYVGVGVGAIVGDEEATVGFGRVHTDGPPPDGHTSFQVGSVTKVVTALLLADAHHRREVALDQRLDTLLPGVAKHPLGRPITLVDLASHTAGLPRLPPGLWKQALRHSADPYAHLTRDDLVAALRRRPRRRAGRRPRYSNFGAGVLGQALEVATRRSYGDLVAERVAAPLGLRATGIEVDNTHGPVAQGHDRRGRPVPDWDMAALAGAGALRSTPRDLLRLLRAHLEPDGTPLADAIRTICEPRRRVSGPLRIGMGWHVLGRAHKPPRWWHNGGTGGFFSFVGFDPEARTAVAVLANSARSVDRIGTALLDDLERT